MIYLTTDPLFRSGASGTSTRKKRTEKLPPFYSFNLRERSNGINVVLVIGYKLHNGALFGGGKCDLAYDDEKNELVLMGSINGKIRVFKQHNTQCIALTRFLSFCGIERDKYAGKYLATKDLDGNIHIDLNFPVRGE